MAVRHPIVLSFGAGAAVIAALGAAAPQRASQSTDPVAQEVRDLRLSLERAATVSARVSLTMQRVNGAQARLSAIQWELADVRSQLGRATAEVARYGTAVNDFERDYPQAVKDPVDGVRYPGFMQYQQSKALLEGQRQLEQSLRTREMQLAAEMTKEQAQWSELARQLDALEGSLRDGRD